MATSIKGILFDVGDTLLDFGKVDIRTLFEAGARLSYEYLQKLGQPLPGLAKYHRRQLWAIRWNYFKSRFTRREFNALDLIGKLAIQMGHDLTPQQMLELAWLWYQPLGQCARIEPGLSQLLRDFRQQGLTMGLISNTFVPGAVLDRQLNDAGLLESLSVRVYSCDVGYRKPNPNIFAIALGRANLTAGETLFVGDSLKADIEGANRVGMISVLKDPAGRHADSRVKPAYRIAKLAELTEILARQP